jgi:hypothetical protein
VCFGAVERLVKERKKSELDRSTLPLGAGQSSKTSGNYVRATTRLFLTLMTTYATNTTFHDMASPYYRQITTTTTTSM